MPGTPTYDALPAERRLEIERRLYERIFGGPYSERSIPEDASSRQKEYLISCIRNAIHTRNDGRQIPPHQVDATREMSARELGTSPAGEPPVIMTASARARERMRQLCEEGRLPHRLENNFVEAGMVMRRETGIPRHQIAEKFLKPLGYRHRGDRGSRGYVAFEKVRPDGARLGCDFDFGTWRASVIAMFAYSGGTVKVRFPLQYWREDRPVEIVSRELLEQAMENIAFVLRELEELLSL